MPQFDEAFVSGIAGVPDYREWALSPVAHRYALVIPVINENGRLTAQLERIRAASPDVDVIVADGGSTDGSTNPADLSGLGVSALLVKQGPGRLSAQLRMAIHYCLARGYAGIITMDGNGKDGVEGVARIAQALAQGYDFVQGSRFVQGGRAVRTPLDRYLAIRLVHSPLTSLGAHHWFTDTTNGFRGHSARLLSDPRVAPLREVFDTYELLAYLPVIAARLGYRVTEVPVQRAYPRSGMTPTKIRGIAAHGHLMGILLRACAGGYRPADPMGRQGVGTSGDDTC